MHHCAGRKQVAHMKNRAKIFRRYLACFSFFILLFAISRPLAAQDPIPVDEDGNPLTSTTTSELLENDAIEASLQLFSIDELQEFVGPVALYPDNLLAIILPASAYPLQIVLAARFLEQLETDSSLVPDENWDESVIALLNYPEVVQMMNEDIQWTWQLGDAVVSQESDVLTAIGLFRDRAYTAGNLQSDEYQNVTSSEEKIIITQVEETVVYVPYYVPEEVVIYQTRPVYHYYPTAYPVYYYPYPASYRFRSGYFWGVTTAFNIGWHDYHLHVYHPSYSRHPYYGRLYASRHHYRRPDLRAFNRYYVDNNYRRSRDRDRDGSYWWPQKNSGARPSDRRNRNRYGTTNQRTAFNDIGANRENRRDGGAGGNRRLNGENGLNSQNGPNRGFGGLRNRRDSPIDPSARNGFAETNVETAASSLRTASNERQGERQAGNNRGAGRLRPDRSPIGSNTTSVTVGSELTSSDDRRRIRGSNNDRTIRSDRSANAAITSNRQGSQMFQEPGNLESSEFNSGRNTEETVQRPRATNGTALSATRSRGSISPTQATNRLRLQNRSNRSADSNRQRQVSSENRQSSQRDSTTGNSRLIQRESSNANPTGQRSRVAPANQNTRSISRADSVRDQVQRSRQRAAPVQSSNRQVRESPRSQSSVAVPRREVSQRRSEPAQSRRSAAAGVSRSAPSVSTREPSSNDRSRGRRQRP